MIPGILDDDVLFLGLSLVESSPLRGCRCTNCVTLSRLISRNLFAEESAAKSAANLFNAAAGGGL